MSNCFLPKEGRSHLFRAANDLKIFLRMVSGINTSKLRKNSSSKKEL
jgi:hypothetical protein